jgi:hypothetical protein
MAFFRTDSQSIERTPLKAGISAALPCDVNIGNSNPAGDKVESAEARVLRGSDLWSGGQHIAPAEVEEEPHFEGAYEYSRITMSDAAGQ